MKKKKKFTLAAACIFLTVLLMHLVNKIIFFLSIIKEKLFSENSSYYNWRFGKIFYTKKGSGSPLLLIHDLDSTSSDYEWKEVINELAKEHTVFTLDLLGCGRSDKPKITYTTYLYVQLRSDFIRNVIKHKTKVIVTANSSAAVIMACFIDSQLFSNIIMVNPTDFATLNKAPKYRHKVFRYFIEAPVIGTFFYNIAVGKTMLSTLFKEKFFYNKNKIKERMILAYLEAAHLGGSSAKYLYASTCCHYCNCNILHAIKELNNNIYIIGGEKLDNIEETCKEYVMANPAIETIILEKTKYLPQLEEPEEFINLCKIYLH